MSDGLELVSYDSDFSSPRDSATFTINDYRFVVSVTRATGRPSRRCGISLPNRFHSTLLPFADMPIETKPTFTLTDPALGQITISRDDRVPTGWLAMLDMSEVFTTYISGLVEPHARVARALEKAMPQG